MTFNTSQSTNMKENAGCFAAILWIATIVVSILTGIMAWNWIEPESFGGALLFLAAWWLFSYIGHILLGGLISIIGNNLD